MQSKLNVLTPFLQLAACAALAVGFLARAEEPKAEVKKTDAAGTWSWTVPGRDGGPARTNTLALKVEGDKLSGNVASLGRDGQIRQTPIEAGQISGEDISFTMTREFNGNKLISKYTGKLTGDTIKGKIEMDRNGEIQTRDWEARRVAEPADKADKAAKK
jgi:hypothetical protein